MNAGYILLVEDNASDVALAQRAFRISGIGNELRVAEDGQQALDYLLCAGAYSDREALDVPLLVLLDLKLPRLGGLEVVRMMRADPRTRRIPVVILTSSLEENDIAAAYDNGANSYIRKPVVFEQFTDAVRQLHRYWLGLNQPPPPFESSRS